MKTAFDVPNIRETPPSLSRRTIHMWHVNLDEPAGVTSDPQGVLSADEWARAGQFRFQRHRGRFMAARTALRRLLSHYGNCPPEALRFGLAIAGKPYLHPAADLPDIRFNVSHSEGHALFAFTLGREIGVDIECQRSSCDLRLLARDHFSPREIRALESFPPDAQMGAFFRCWSRKEACIKAVGLGLQIPLDSFSVSLGETPEPNRIEVHRQQLSIRAAHPIEGFATALAICGDELTEVELFATSSASARVAPG
jgi:4'-phosphopantetheinyl transferase